MRDDLDLPPHVPAHLTTAASFVNVLRVAALLELAPVVGQNVRGNDLGVVFQQA